MPEGASQMRPSLSFRGAQRRGICISLRRHIPLNLALLFCVALVIFCLPANARTKKQLPAHPFNLNTATLKQLEELPGVGPVTAHAILNFREKSGPFKSVNDLLVIPRISKKKLDKIRPYVFVKPPAKPIASPAKPPAGKSASPAKRPMSFILAKPSALLNT